MEPRASTIERVCVQLAADDVEAATRILNAEYPFLAPVASARRYTIDQMTAVFLRDGFIDRYSGDRLVFPAVLRVISKALPDVFPFHPSWKMSESHTAYWDLMPTIDHQIPASLSGSDEQSNWFTTSMSRNAAKGNASLEQIGWIVHPPGLLTEWDGLSSWLLDHLTRHPELGSDAYVARDGPGHFGGNSFACPISATESALSKAG